MVVLIGLLFVMGYCCVLVCVFGVALLCVACCLGCWIVAVYVLIVL